jgi:hypothetical protein
MRTREKEQLTLPPTPSDFERIELVQRSIAVIKKSSDDIVKVVGEHAYGGFPESVVRKLWHHIGETETLCRRCEHCLSSCNPRAVTAAELDGRSLAREAHIVTTNFEQVASAARSVLSQLRPAGVIRTGAATSEQRCWDELFELPVSESAVATGLSPLRPPPLTPEPSYQLDELKGRAGTVGSGVRHSNLAHEHGRPTELMCSPLLPTPPPQLRPPSAALSLWNARTPVNGTGDALGGGASGSSRRARTDDCTGAFDALDTHAREGPHVDSIGRGEDSSSTCASAQSGIGGSFVAAGGVDSVHGLSDPIGPSVEGSSGREALRTSLAEVRRVTERMHAVIAAHVWEGFSPDAVAELHQLQIVGRTAARSSRHIARALAGGGGGPEGDDSALKLLVDDVERAISDFGVAMEMAHHTIGQRMPCGDIASATSPASPDGVVDSDVPCEGADGSHSPPGMLDPPPLVSGLDLHESGTTTADSPMRATPAAPTPDQQQQAAAPQQVEKQPCEMAAALSDHEQPRLQGRPKRQPSPPEAHSAPPEGHHAQHPQSQLQAQVLTHQTSLRRAMETNEELIESQKSALHTIATEVQGLNELFVELGHLVASQGAEVETVAMCAEETLQGVAAAREQLEIYEDSKGGCTLS